MAAAQDPIDRILEALKEREKEVACLHRVDEVLRRADAPLAEVLRGIALAIPPGYQHPHVCIARVAVGDVSAGTPGYAPTEWVQAADVVVAGRPVGRVEVAYTVPTSPADEGPFLKEERRLIETIARRVAKHVARRRGPAAPDDPQGAMEDITTEHRQDWWLVIEYLRDTDRNLLIRLSRKMLNHLCWNGIEEAQQHLQRFAPEQTGGGGGAADDNRPIARKSIDELERLAQETFRIAAAHLSEDEIVSRIRKWIKDDRSSFLLEALESASATVGDITAAIERFRLSGVDEHEMTRPMQTAVRVALVRRFFSDETDFINHAKNYVCVRDFYDITRRVISPPGGHGKLGGKSAGLFLAAQVVRGSAGELDFLGEVRVPKTWYVTSDGVIDFVQYNHLDDVYNRKYLDLDQVRREYPHVVQVFKNSRFSPEIVKGLSAALDDLGERPIVVRSSSLLEDRIGSAFSGKYKSLFLANQGGKRERLAALMDAVAEVYASIFGPDPLEYRAERGMLDLHEEMGIMIQEVVGTPVGDWFFPAFSGVAFSNNEFRWSVRIKREDGLLRMVPGLGTRAVDRLGDDYPVLIAPGQPGLRVNQTPGEMTRYAPRMLDVINLRTQAFESVEVTRLLRECGAQYPMVADLVSVVAEGGVRRPLPFQIDWERDELIFTFDGLVARTPFVARMRALLRLLQERIGGPVDLEFAHDGTNLHLLQCRPQSYAAGAVSVPIPADLPQDRVLFTANRFVSNGRVPDITHVVYVDPRRYRQLTARDDLREVGRIVGRLNKLLPKRQFILMGPGRWGSRGDIRLGVTVTYSEINNTAVLVEIARKEGNYVPDLSFGTHFFQDLVEASIRYLPLYPDEPDVLFNEEFLTKAPSVLVDLLPEHARLADTVRVIDVPRATGGLVLKVLMNADQERAVGVLATPSAGREALAPTVREAPAAPDVHWRWRVRAAELIAAKLDPARFGVRGLWLFGSTKNATAGPSSDIDLLVHFSGAAGQRAELEAWLEGWSLSLAEANFLRTGVRREGILDLHWLSDDDVAQQRGFAQKIGAVTDAARPLPLGTALPAR